MNSSQLTNTINSKSDIFGLVASSLCMVHCLATPFLFAAQAAVGATCSDIGPLWWKMIDFFFLVITFFAIVYTVKSTLLKWMPLVLYVLWTVLAILVVNKFFHIVHVPHTIIYIPAIALSLLHLYNWNYCRCHEDRCSVA